MANSTVSMNFSANIVRSDICPRHSVQGQTSYFYNFCFIPLSLEMAVATQTATFI